MRRSRGYAGFGRPVVAAVALLLAAGAALLSAGGVAEAGAMTIAPQDILHVPLLLGEPKVKSDAEGDYLCEATVAYLALSVKGAADVMITPRLEVHNPFGDLADCVALDYSFDGAHFINLAAVKSKRGHKQGKIVFDRPCRVRLNGRRRLFLRLRVDHSFYPGFTRFRGMKVETRPAAASVAIDPSWGKEDFWRAFAKAYPPSAPKPAPHVLYLVGPLSFDLGLMVRKEPVDSYLFFDVPASWPRERALDLARTYEALDVHFFIRTHDFDTAKAVFKAAPRCCCGLCWGEVWNCGAFMKDPKLFLTSLEVARRAGKKVVWYEHARDGSYGLGWWGWYMQHPDLFREVFSPRYRDTLVPLHENNDPRAPMANLGFVLGLWLQGVSSQWGASIQTWWWNDTGRGVCETCPPELITRMMLEFFSLGAQWYEIEPLSMYEVEGPKGLPVRSKQWPGLEAAYRLLASGKAHIPGKADLASLCRTGFRLQAGQSPGSIFDPGVGPASRAQVAERYASRYLYGVRVCSDELLPRTPYGVLPLFTSLAPVPKGFAAVDTDGQKLVAGGKQISLADLAAMAARSAAPITSPNACALAWREGGGYRLCLLHPQPADPGDLEATVRVPAGIRALRDLQTGEKFAVRDGNATVPLSAARDFRLLETVGG